MEVLLEIALEGAETGCMSGERCAEIEHREQGEEVLERFRHLKEMIDLSYNTQLDGEVREAPVGVGGW